MTSYYHGGVPGLQPGDRILPPDVTGQQSKATRTDRVFLTTEPVRAVIFAAFSVSRDAAWVYQVEPDEPLEADEDWSVPGESIQAPGATVIAIVDWAPIMRDYFGVDLTFAEIRHMTRLGLRLQGRSPAGV